MTAILTPAWKPPNYKPQTCKRLSGPFAAIPQDAAEPGQQSGRFTFLPLMQQGQVVLVLGYHRLDAQRSDRFARAAAIEVICHQANLALERLRFAQAAEDARTSATREQLRAALLTSLSHDLRTPLARSPACASWVPLCHPPRVTIWRWRLRKKHSGWRVTSTTCCT